MISKNKIKEIAKELNKKISKRAHEKLESQIIFWIKEKIKDASIKADFSGRKIIQYSDIED